MGNKENVKEQFSVCWYCVHVCVCVCVCVYALIIWQVYRALCIHMAEFKRFAEFPPEGCPWVFARILLRYTPWQKYKAVRWCLKTLFFFSLRSGSEAQTRTRHTSRLKLRCVNQRPKCWHKHGVECREVDWADSRLHNLTDDGLCKALIWGIFFFI